MSAYENRLLELQGHAKDAHEEILGLPDDAWPDKGEKQRLEGVLAYARTVLEATDASLVSEQTWTAVRDALAQISSNASSVPANAGPWGGQVIDALSRLPVTRGREVEQSVKAAAATFQRSAQQRLSTLRSRFARAQGEIRAIEQHAEAQRVELGEALEQRKATITEEIEALRVGFEARIAEYEEQLRSEQSALSELRTSQTSAFEDAEQQRIAASRQQLDEAEQGLRQLKEQAAHELEAHVAEIRRMAQESAQLVGAIGLAGTAERYGEEAAAQKRVADSWRYATVVLALLAVVGAIVAVLEKHPVAETFAGKLALSVILGGIATYAARQSSYHRHREQRARDLQLELTAFSPFIEPLSAEQQEEERVIMTRKTFGKISVAAAPEEEPGPHFLSFALQRRKPRAVAEDASG